MKISIFSPFPIFPPQNGGAIRIYKIACELAKKNEVAIYYFCYKPNTNHKFTKKKIKFIPVFQPFLSILIFIHLIFHLPYNYLYSFSKLYIRYPALFESINLSDVLIVEECFIFNWVHTNSSKKILVDNQNVEYILEKLKYKLLNQYIKFPFEIIKKIELKSSLLSNHLICVSSEDKNEIMKLYRINTDKISIVNNGFSKEKENNDQVIFVKNQFHGKKIIAFVASDHRPNIEALKFIKGIAHNSVFKDMIFLIIGSVSQKKQYNNVYCTGRVTSVSKYLSIADIAINPVISGSGSNIKMFEYFAFKKPVISTPFGIRGLGVKNNQHVIVSNRNNFSDKILELLKDKKAQKKFADNAYKFVNKYSWNNNTKKYETILRKVIRE